MTSVNFLEAQFDSDDESDEDFVEDLELDSDSVSKPVFDADVCKRSLQKLVQKQKHYEPKPLTKTNINNMIVAGTNRLKRRRTMKKFKANATEFHIAVTEKADKPTSKIFTNHFVDLDNLLQMIKTNKELSSLEIATLKWSSSMASDTPIAAMLSKKRKSGIITQKVADSQQIDKRKSMVRNGRA